jgi:hypothetical protein
MTLNHFEEQSGSVLDRLCKYLKEISIVVIVNQDVEALREKKQIVTE